MKCLHEYNFQALEESAEDFHRTRLKIKAVMDYLENNSYDEAADNLLSEVNNDLEQYSDALNICVRRISEGFVPPEGRE